MSFQIGQTLNFSFLFVLVGAVVLVDPIHVQLGALNSVDDVRQVAVRM